MKSSSLLALIPLLPLLGAAINLLFARKISRAVTHAVAVGAVAAAFVVGVIAFVQLFPLWKAHTDTTTTLAGLHQVVFDWIQVGSLKLEMAFRFDTLTAVMVLVITGIGTLIHIYSTGYMHDDPRYAAYFGYLNLFTGAMLILVLADNLVVMFIGWEGVGLCSYLLIGFWFQNEAYAYAGRKAFVVNRIGDFAFILGVCLLFWATGTVGFRELQSPDNLKLLEQSFFGVERIAFFAGLFLFIGACGKSAQIPLYVWLPDAMAGPTPVSALIHAATMVTAGVYMVARMSFVYAQSVTASAVVAVVGALTALFAASMAFAQKDIKKVLAYSTVSQLGFMFTAVGVGAYTAGIFHLMTHAVFKAGLFLGAGSVMHAMSGSGDITKMGGLKQKIPHTHLTFKIFCLAIAGIPIFAGFFSKDEILAGVASKQLPPGFLPNFGPILWGVLMTAALGTAFYMWRLYYLVFSGECRADEETKHHIHESPPSMTVPLLILGGLTCVVGFLGMPALLAHLLHIPNGLAAWLRPVLASSDLQPLSAGTEAVLMVIALLAAASGIFLARTLYRRGPSLWVHKITASGPGKTIHRIVENKFYVDELYDLIIVRPLRWFANVLFQVVDRFLIDLVVVDGSARVVDVVGRVVRWFQNGQVQRYLVAILVGGALMFFISTRPTLKIRYLVVDNGVVSFLADTGGGAPAQNAKIEWDFDADGRADSTDKETTWNFGAPGSYEVVLRSKDNQFGRGREVRQIIVIPDDGSFNQPGREVQ